MPHLRHFVSETMNLIADHSKVLAVLINLHRLKLFLSLTRCKSKQILRAHLQRHTMPVKVRMIYLNFCYIDNYSICFRALTTWALKPSRNSMWRNWRNRLIRRKIERSSSAPFVIKGVHCYNWSDSTNNFMPFQIQARRSSRPACWVAQCV